MRRVAVALLALAGCHEAPPARRPVRETAAAMNPAALPEAPVSGMLDGRAFTLRTAWLRVVRRAGHERTSLVLSEGRPSRLCGRPDPNDARQVVVRFTGVTQAPAGTTRIDGTDPRREVFAEARGAHGVEGLGSGHALLVTEVSPEGEVSGRVRACFPDAHGSCVGGSFRAPVCWDELDLDGPRGARDRAPDGGAR